MLRRQVFAKDTADGHQQSISQDADADLLADREEVGIGYQIPIIAVTANASSEIKKRCFDVGMNDFTTKPTNFKLLIKKMKAQLNSSDI